MTQSQEDKPDNANDHCVGPQSEMAGKDDGCQGCPNQQICASIPKVPKVDPSLAYIKERMSQIKNKLLVLSGKGGVGKSTICVQIAMYLAGDPDIEIALVDLDLTGPSIPRMLGLENNNGQLNKSDQSIDQINEQGVITESGSGWHSHTLLNYPNVQTISTGLLLPTQDTAVIWRGARKHEMITRFLRDVVWGELDFMIADLPPGTSDEHLSITQYLDDSSAIIVTTPQEMSIQDVRKEINFCKKVKLNILGVIENMSGFVCPSCNGESEIFPRGQSNNSVKQMCEQMGVEYLGSLVLDPKVTEISDKGGSVVDIFPDKVWSKQFNDIMERVIKKVDDQQ